MEDYSHVTPGALPMEGHLSRLVDITHEICAARRPYTGSPEFRQIKREQIRLINLLTQDAYGLRELSRAVGRYETWANTTVRDWRRRQAAIAAREKADNEQ